MTRHERLDQTAKAYPLGTCIKHLSILGRVVSWTLYPNDSVSLDVVTVPGHHIMHLEPASVKIIQPSVMPDYTVKP